MNKDFGVIAKLAGITQNVSFHTARHTNATLLIYNGINITTVQKLLGHKSVRTTQIYANIMDMTIVHVYGNKLTGNDWIYGGDKDKWTKFAYAVIVRNLASLSNKNDFTTKYADELIECAKKSFSTADDDAVIKVSGGSQQVPYAYYNNACNKIISNLLRKEKKDNFVVRVSLLTL